MKPRFYYQPSCLAFGISASDVGIYDADTNLKFKVLYFKVDFLFWHLHFDIRYTRKTPL